MRWTRKFAASFSAPARAALWITLAGLGFTLTMIGVREVTPELHILEAVLFRCLFGVVFMLPWMYRVGRIGLITQRPALIVTRGTLAYFVSAFYFMAATLVPLADMVSVTFTRPILGTIAAIIFLHELANARRWTSIAFGFLGMLIIVRPGFQELNLGILLVLAGVVIQTGNTIIVKFLTRTDPPDTIAFYHSLVMIPVATIPAIIVWVTPTIDQWFWLIAIGATGILTQRAQSRAFAAADASFVLAFAFLRLPIAAVIGFLVFSEIPDIWVWIGAAVICTSSAYIAHRESLMAKKSEIP
jgi:drug/metabolite transporter (DMT)-like permease